jgi:hypothetical protein
LDYAEHGEIIGQSAALRPLGVRSGKWKPVFRFERATTKEN